MTRSTKTTGDYEVGYGKPPVHTRFVKGRSGNPKGGSKAQGLCRAKEIVLREAYRTLVVKEEYGCEPLPAIQAVARSQIALAAKGHAPSQRAVLAAVMAIEEERAMAAAQSSDEIAKMSDVEIARRICFLLDLGEEELRAQRAAVPEPNAADAAAGRTVSERALPPETGILEWTLSNGAGCCSSPPNFKADELLFAARSLGRRVARARLGRGQHGPGLRRDVPERRRNIQRDRARQEARRKESERRRRHRRRRRGRARDRIGRRTWRRCSSSRGCA